MILKLPQDFADKIVWGSRYPHHDATSAWDAIAKLRNANLANCNLTRADLAGADLSDANLDGADFTDADLASSLLPKPAALAAARNLDKARNLDQARRPTMR